MAGARIVHASPVSDLRSFAPEPADDEVELVDGTTHPRLVFGHTHIQFRRPSAVADLELVNPGSVGVPLDGDPRSAYALIHPDRTLELRRVAYDTAAAVAGLRENFGAQAVGRDDHRPARALAAVVTGQVPRSWPQASASQRRQRRRADARSRVSPASSFSCSSRAPAARRR